MTDVLILGGSGKVGRLLRARWRPERLRLAWQGRSMTGAPGWVDWSPGQDLPHAAVVLLLSGVTAGTEAELAQNTRIGLDVAAAARAAGVRHVLLASTMAVYGTTRAGGASEDCPSVGPRPYGQAKLEMERAMAGVLAGSETGLTALRLGNVVGADLLGTVLASGRRVRLDQFADGEGPWRSYLGPSLLGRVVEALAHRMDLPAVLNVAAQQPVAMSALLQAAGLGFDWQPAGPAAVQHAAMDCRRLAALLPPIPAQETAQALVADWTGAAA